MCATPSPHNSLKTQPCLVRSILCEDSQYASSFFSLPLSSRRYPQRSLREDPADMTLVSCMRPRFIPIQKKIKHYVCIF
jgi:hypothetical protein